MIKITLLIIAFFSCVSSAQTAPDFYDPFDNASYRFVVGSCHWNVSSVAVLVENTKKDFPEYFQYFFLLDTNVLKSSNNLVVRRGIGKNTDRLLNSYGYFEGLKNCFPDSLTKRNLYTANLLFFDAAGKLVSISILVGGGGLFYKALVFVGERAVLAPAVALLKKSGVSALSLARVQSAARRFGITALNTFPLALLAGGLFVEKQRQQILQNPEVVLDSSSSDLRIQLSKNLNRYILALLLSKLSSQNESPVFLDETILTQKQIVLFYIDSLLETSDLDPQEESDLISLRLSLS